MKSIILISVIVLILLHVSCNQKTGDNSQKTETSAERYSCPMHPEVHGAKGEKCPKCGMELTVPVSKQNKNHESHQMTDTVSE